MQMVYELVDIPPKKKLLTRLFIKLFPSRFKNLVLRLSPATLLALGEGKLQALVVDDSRISRLQARYGIKRITVMANDRPGDLVRMEHLP